MDRSVYTRPNKSKTLTVKNRRGKPERAFITMPNVIAVDFSTECHVTPSNVAGRMVDYLELEAHDNLLEPHIGTGSLVSAVLNGGYSFNHITGVERNYNLSQCSKQRFEGHENINIINQCFLDYCLEAGNISFSKIILNPPFRNVKKHVSCALKLLSKNGLLVALVPVSFQDDDAEELEILSNETFSTAKVKTKIICFDRR
jgi:protein-L-isoaspartate O-methyltransferase